MRRILNYHLIFIDDSVGGQVYYSAGASVISDIPSKAHWPVKAHAWVNAGRLDGVNQGSFNVSYLWPRNRLIPLCALTAVPLTQTLSQTLARPSISAGVGLIYRFDPIRVEVNFGVPLVASRSDGQRRGVQVGMGLEFL